MIEHDGQWYAETRKEARERGDKYYFTGIPCKWGHVAPRMVSGKCCYKCNRISRDLLDAQNPGYRSQFANNTRDYYRRNKDAMRQRHKEWREENPHKMRMYTSHHRRIVKRATPAWADFQEIEYVYSLAHEKGHVVDHLVPLKSDYVCGLHCADNLRVVPAQLNWHKNNRYWPDMPDDL